MSVWPWRVRGIVDVWLIKKNVVVALQKPWLLCNFHIAVRFLVNTPHTATYQLIGHDLWFGLLGRYPIVIYTNRYTHAQSGVLSWSIQIYPESLCGESSACRVYRLATFRCGDLQQSKHWLVLELVIIKFWAGSLSKWAHKPSCCFTMVCLYHKIFYAVTQVALKFMHSMCI